MYNMYLHSSIQFIDLIHVYSRRMCNTEHVTFMFKQAVSSSENILNFQH